MTQAVAQILEAAEQPSASDRAELADRIVERLAHEIPPDIAQAETGEVTLIPSEEALAPVRQIVELAS